jgi:hypothetical protein
MKKAWRKIVFKIPRAQIALAKFRASANPAESTTLIIYTGNYVLI